MGKQEQDKKDLQFKKLQLLAGFVLLIFMILIHTLVKEIPVWVMAIPGFLMGFDPREWVRLK